MPSLKQVQDYINNRRKGNLYVFLSKHSMFIKSKWNFYLSLFYGIFFVPVGTFFVPSLYPNIKKIFFMIIFPVSHFWRSKLEVSDKFEFFCKVNLALLKIKISL